MRWLVFGDVHGNLPALELMFKAEYGNYDAMICHGDVVNYGPWSNECVDLLSAQENAILLKGNHEDYFISGQYDGNHPVAKAFFEFNLPNFERLHQISNYQKNHQIKKTTIQHTFKDQYLFKDTNITGLDGDYIIGHSHQQYSREVAGYRLVNTGSVGQNREFINIINYVILDDETNAIELKQIMYDHTVIINELIAQNYPLICINYYKNKKTQSITKTRQHT